MGSPMLVELVRRILERHVDPLSGVPEAILLGYADPEVAGEHISRYTLAQRFSRGVVLDVASGSCYGSSILARGLGVKYVVSVDLDLDLLAYGRLVYGAEAVQASAVLLPFRERAFDVVVSLETLEHLSDVGSFLGGVKRVLKGEGWFILSTPNKLYSSPFLPRPLNPYHMREWYLGPLLRLLEGDGFRVLAVYGGKAFTPSVLVRRIFGSFIKYLFPKFSRFIDKIYKTISDRPRGARALDPSPTAVRHQRIVPLSNLALYEYFVVVMRGRH